MTEGTPTDVQTAEEAGQAPGGLRAAARRNKDVASRDQRKAWEDAERNQKWHIGIGVAGIIAGALAGVAALGEAAPGLTAGAAALATLLAALQTFLNPQKKANHHWSRAAGLGALALKWDSLASAPQEPTKQDFDDLIKEYEQLHKPES